MRELAAHPEGVVLLVRAQPGARENAIRGVQNGVLKVAVTQVAEKGKANKAIVELLCRSLCAQTLPGGTSGRRHGRSETVPGPRRESAGTGCTYRASRVRLIRSRAGDRRLAGSAAQWTVAEPSWPCPE